jgi:hypothetical protein
VGHVTHPHLRRTTASDVLRLHLPLVLGIAVCLFAGWFELTRARAGHTIAWVYVFEWPAFAVAGVVIWWRLVTGHDASRPGPADTADRETGPAEDPGLTAWHDYLAALDSDRRDGADRD